MSCPPVLPRPFHADPGGWTVEQHRHADPACIAALSPDQIATLPWPAWLPAEAVARLSVSQLLAIPVRLWGLMPGDWLRAVHPERLAAMPPDRVAWWTAEATARLDAAQVRLLSPHQVAALRWPEALSAQARRVLDEVMSRTNSLT